MYYRKRNRLFDFREAISAAPDAAALVRGSSDYPEISGSVKFYQTLKGVLVVADIDGLPVSDDRCGNDIFAFHIHSGAGCSGNEEDEFADVGSHYNPDGCPHPYHAGDIPPLFTSGQKAFLAFLTDRFTVNQIIGKTVIIHEGPDDFTTQPAGNAGTKIACGEINAFYIN